MYIRRKVFSSVIDEKTGEEKLFSVKDRNLNVKVFAEYEKGVTKYDRSDNFKRMNDADILAEKKRSNARSYINSAKAGGLGAVIGSGLGAGLGLAVGRKGNYGRTVKKLAGAGAALGALASGGGKLAATHKEREENRFVNRRLKYAQTQAKRREGRDWVSNNHREGYSYAGGGRSSSAPTSSSWE